MLSPSWRGPPILGSSFDITHLHDRHIGRQVYKQAQEQHITER